LPTLKNSSPTAFGKSRRWARKGWREKELEILRGAAQTLVDMVDPPEEGEAGEQPLLERLLGAPERVVKFLTEAPVVCVSHALAFVKSFWPEAPLGMFA
jgi:hypothetical protein